MVENSKIEWTDHTFNPWVGCTKVSPACDHCYAERWARRTGQSDLWSGGRRLTKTWGSPVKWNKAAAKTGTRPRVFCASLADVFDNQVDPAWRSELWRLIINCGHLDWLLLTKRPQNIKEMLPPGWGDGWRNVWLGTTVENQEEAERRIPHLVDVPARVRFLSCEPLLGPVLFLLLDKSRIHWVIAGGESGPGHRDIDLEWVRGLRDQCQFAEIDFFFKQWSGSTRRQLDAKGRELDGVIWNQIPKTEDSNYG